MNEKYTTKLGAGQGLINETRILLDLWQPGMDSNTLNKVALESGHFPNLTARRLHNLIVEGFGYRFLNTIGVSVFYLKILQKHFTSREFEQLLFLAACRSHSVLFDFVIQIYWNAYSSGRITLSNKDAQDFVIRANQDGKTTSPWADSMIERVSGYLTGTCADFGLLEKGRKSIRKILPYRLESKVFIFILYDLHFAGNGDNSVIIHPEFQLFGMNRDDVLSEIKRLSLQGWWIAQTAGDVIRISWRYQSMEDLLDALSKG